MSIINATFFKKLFYVCFLLTVMFGCGVLFFGMMLPPDWYVSRSTVIDAPPAAAYPLVRDLKQWPRWSPWQKKDPAMKVEYGARSAGDGAESRWESATLGTGTMKILDTSRDRLVHYETRIRSGRWDCLMEGRIRFQKRQDGKTSVEWVAVGREEKLLPKLIAQVGFDRMMGPDFEAGLASLKAAAEGSAVPAAPEEAQP